MDTASSGQKENSIKHEIAQRLARPPETDDGLTRLLRGMTKLEQLQLMRFDRAMMREPKSDIPY